MDALSIRKKHESTIMKDVILCCRHSCKFFTETNGLLVEKTCCYLCRKTCNEFTQIYVFVCTGCFKNLLQKTTTLYDLNFGWNKHYLDKRDIRQVYLNGLYRFCTLNELNSNYVFCLRRLQII